MNQVFTFLRVRLMVTVNRLLVYRAASALFSSVSHRVRLG